MTLKKINMPFAVKFILIVLITVIFITASLSTFFFINLYSISYTLAITNVEKSIANLRDNITNSLERYANLLEDASYGVSVLYDKGPIVWDELSSFFGNIISKTPDVELIYFSTNVKWNLEDGYFITSPLWIPDDDWDQTTRPWFINAKLAETDIVFSEPYLDANTGDIIISLSKVVYNKDGIDIGVIAADILVTKLNMEINRTIVFPDQRLYLLNKEGLYITNSDSDKVLNVNFFKDLDIDYFEEAFSSRSFHVQDSTKDFYAAEIPLTGWYLVSLTPRAVIFAGTNQLLIRMIILCFSIFLLAVGISIIITYYMLSLPLKEVTKIASAIANFDFSTNFKYIGHNEIGETQRSLVRIKNNFKIFFTSLVSNATMLSDSVNNLSASTQEITSTANEQSTSVAEIVATMEKNRELAAKAAEKTSDVARLAAHTQELSCRGADLRDTNENMMLNIRNQNYKIIEIINNLADMLLRIDESIQLIDSIADRTKLIAFNAALEASSSVGSISGGTGETGSRFSVVAGEIRRFADNVVESVNEIKEKISELQEAAQMLITEANSGTNAIDNGYRGMIEQKEVLKNIVDASINVSDRCQQISDLSKQQELASTQVFTALKEISAGVSHFVSSTSQTTATMEKLKNMSEELKENISKYNFTNEEDV